MEGPLRVSVLPDALTLLVPAFAGATLCTPLVAAWAARVGLVDQPGTRTTHERPVPRVGGLAVLGGVAGGLLVLAVHRGLDDIAAAAAWLLPALLFFGIGLVDDARPLRARWKFLLQALVAALAVALGLRWEGAALAPFPALTFGAATPVMSWLWIVAVVTVINLIDGLDSITALTGVVLLGAAAGGSAGPWDGGLYVIALGALAGFAPWNLRPARAFLGDGGTHLLGFLVATAALRGPGGAHGLPWVLASAPLLPAVIDIGWGLIMKRRHGIPLGEAHNQHLSQRLTHAGLSHAASAARYGLLALLALVMVGWVAPRFGLGVCVGLSIVILAAHLLHARRAARRIPYRY